VPRRLHIHFYEQSKIVRIEIKGLTLCLVRKESCWARSVNPMTISEGALREEMASLEATTDSSMVTIVWERSERISVKWC
jgi:hypothetical protein